MKSKNYKRLGDYVHEVDERNTDLSIKKLVGVNLQKEFIPSVANIIGTDLSRYKIVRYNQFGLKLMSVERDRKMPISLMKSKEPSIISTAYYVFEVNDEKELLPDYLFMQIKQSEFDRRLWFSTGGDVRGGASWDNLMDMPILVPSIDEQERIVSQYKTIERRISTDEEFISKLESTIQLLYRKMFVEDIDIEDLPNGWSITTLDELSEFIAAGTIPDYTDKGSDLVLGQKCVSDHIITLDKARHHIPKANCKFVKYGDILINSTGDGTLGRVGQVTFHPERLAYDSNMTLVRPSKDYLMDYLFEFLKTKEDYFVKISQGSTNQTRLYCSMVRPLQIVLPPESILCDFQGLVDKINAEKRLREKERTIFQKMLTLLQSKLSHQS